MAATERFDSSMARAWKRRVDYELDAIKVLMLEIAEVAHSDPGDEDSIAKALTAIGENELATWNDVTKAFSELSETMQEIIHAYEQYGEDAYDKIHYLLSRRA